MADLGIKGKVSIVTGSARGIGRAISEKLAEEGATLIITDINEEMAKSTANDISSKFNVDTLALKHDVSLEDSTKEVVDKIIEKYSRIDILINNAGITKDANLMIMPKSSWDVVIAINLTGAFLCTKFVSKQMLKKRSGRIVNIASVSGIMGNIGQANYSASKAGLIGLTKTTAKELATRRITVNAIAPGYIQSDMTHVLSDEVTKKMTDMIPMKTYGTPEDVADAVLFFVSNKAKYITGQVLNVDGGMIMWRERLDILLQRRYLYNDTVRIKYFHTITMPVVFELFTRQNTGEVMPEQSKGDPMLPERQKQKYEEFFDSTAKNGILDMKTTVMIQLAASFSIGCYPWMEHFFGVAKENGITDEEIGAVQSIAMGVSAGRIRAQFKQVREKMGLDEK